MQAHQASVKLFVDRPSALNQDLLIPIFHRWVREQRLPDTLLIDVADYRHVHHGPGVMLIAHEAHYGMDGAGGELGLVVTRKRDPIRDVGDCLDDAFGRALAACRFLEQEPELAGAVRFRGDRAVVKLASRLVADNTPACFDELRSHLAPLLRRLYPGADARVTQVGDARDTLGVELRCSEDPRVELLLERLGA